ncbi:EamA family transporter [Paenibacillus sp. M.A.Huq-84]|uniref:EamA family transporter n=1 Tax=Paenibacillus sp. M.A.Huq-84 TaxID=3459298 RepID=UPI0040408948
MLYGGILGVAASWAVYFTLVNSGDVSKVASYTFLVPFVSILTGTLLLRESFTFQLFAGLILIAVSIFFINGKPKKIQQMA